MKIKKLILKITLFLCIWIFGLSLVGILIKTNSGYNISNTKASDFYESDYFKNSYLSYKLERLVDYYNDKKYIDDYDKSKVEFSIVNSTDNASEDFSIDSIKNNHKTSYSEVFVHNYYDNSYGNIDKKYKDNKYLAVPKTDFFAIMNKYIEKNRRKVQKDAPAAENKGYNAVNDLDEDMYNDNEVKYYYGWIDDDFDDSCKIFKKSNTDIFVYSSNDATYYNKYIGWIDQSAYENCNNIYIPMKYIDNSSQEAKEQSILTAPCFFSLRELYVENFDDYLDKRDSVFYGKNEFSSKNTNFLFSIKDNKTGKVVTNSKFDDNLIKVSEMNAGTIFNINDRTDKNNILNSKCIKTLNKLDGDCRIAIAVKESNKDLSYDNGLAKARIVYTILRYFKYIVTIFVLSIIAIIGIFAYLLRKEWKTKKINKIDKCRFEVFLICTILSIVAFFGIFDDVYHGSRVIGKVVVMLLGTIIVYIFNIEMILSFIRRISAKSFINSLLLIKVIKKINKYIKYIYDSRSFSAKKILQLIVYLLGNIIFGGLLLVGFETQTTLLVLFSIIVLGVLDFYVLKKLVEDLSGARKIISTANEISSGNLKAKVDIEQLSCDKKELAEALNSIGDGLEKAVDKSIRDERMKAELITNVSDDIKTPLTSIINYVDLLKREDVNNEKAKEYLNVLDKKSQRLKQLIEDLVEASKASTGNIEFQKVPLNINELFNQVIAEYYEKFDSKNLKLVSNISKEIMSICADGRRCYRVIDNLFQNIYKYALEGSRVYLDVYKEDGDIVMAVKNISKEELNINAEELTERFVRGEKSRTSEGSGLGLSIAKNLVELQGGKFDLSIDGDLFKIIIRFKENLN